MKFLSTTLLISVSLLSLAQNKRDTIYFDKTWAVTKQIDSAKYYRIIKETDNLYRVTDYFIESDSVQMTGAFKDYAQTIKEGEFNYYRKGGAISSKMLYKDGKQNGQMISYYATGELYSTEEFVDGVNHGDFIVYYENGKIKRKETFNNGVLKEKACYLENGKKTKYFPRSSPAEFKEGRAALISYLASHIKYPKEAQENGIQGKVYIQFVVSDKGKITNVTLKKSVHPLLDEEAIRVVKSMPNWNPGFIEGKAVNSVFSLPITFSLSK
ncbi:TonB family protein [Fluviicola taffensis]|uniref:TonB family protein n=1 Tax=Fluviicola taffensis TaxID=191579 RepID=UPI0031379C51